MVDLKSVKPQHLWYIVGLIATDGNLSNDGRHINITSKNIEHLLDVKKALGLNNKITKKSRVKSKEKIYSFLQFCDVKFYRYLLNIGLTQRKSLTLGKLKIDNEFLVDFLRGVIDGDGSISTWIHNSNKNRQWSLRIASAAPVFINWLKEEIESYFSVRGKLYCQKYLNKKNPIYTLKFGKLPTKVIIEKIYYKGALSLERKNKQHLRCLQDKNKMVNYKNVINARVA